MRGFKGFDKNFTCRRKQYSENTVFEETGAEICEKGMHFCVHPFDVWNFYPPCDGNGNMNRFAIVEALGDTKSDGNKFCTDKLKIESIIGFDKYVKIGINHIIENTILNTNTNTGDCSAATNTGDNSAATNTGDNSAATNTGNYSAATNTGDRSAATNTGDCSAATNTGDRSAATNTGYRSAATNTGNYSAATNTGYRSAATNTGDYSAATNTGDCSAATNTGYRSAATVDGESSVAISTGYGGKVKGKKGCWVVCTERDANYNILCVKAAKVDGEIIKEDVFYTLKNGNFIEIGDE